MECNCKDWKEYVPQINVCIAMHGMRAGGFKYAGKPFKLCPWCGKILKKKEEK